MHSKKPKKIRADQLLLARGFVESAAQGQAAIMAGLVFCKEQKITTAGHQLPVDAVIELRGKEHPWVSRGGLKLDHALKHFALDVKGFTAIDVGSSTGGFTDVLLSRGANHVFAVDSGTNQLAWKLRQDSRVAVHEQTSARILTDAHIDREIDILVCDASFITLSDVLPVPLGFVRKGGWAVALIKPQFEVERHEVGEGGVVRDAGLHERVCRDVKNWFESTGWDVQGIEKSPITGPSGNIEFLIGAIKG
ncbi:TlyA family RNA methyltransferase [Sphingorhabdus sp. Alg239-R122]|uniref:TlyA family RNA methyltransferase n=1 Tax=Sphingorhabdus sp. Alg239-R122 TaxID=2305989 RepID=UPI0013DA12F4|nr:TlyA family RNA methyltransferase [Sphingorhabdus sp. Alg239-R122]